MEMQIYVSEADKAELEALIKKNRWNVMGWRAAEGGNSGCIATVRPPRRKKTGRAAEVDQAKILELRAAGQSLGQIAAACGCSRAYVQKIVKRGHVTPASRPEPPAAPAAPAVAKIHDKMRKAIERAVATAIGANYQEEHWNEILHHAAVLGDLCGYDAQTEIITRVREEKTKIRKRRNESFGGVDTEKKN